MLQIKPRTGFLLSVPFMAPYLYLYYVIASGTTWWAYLMTGALLATILMFLWVVEIGELGVLKFFGGDAGVRYEAGYYILPNLIPFLREIRLVAGFGLAIVGTNDHQSSIHHYKDDRVTNYQVKIHTESFFRANLDKLINALLRWVMTFEGKDGRIEYYRVGRLLFLMLTIAAYVGCFISPRTQSESSSFSQLVPTWWSQKSATNEEKATSPTVDVLVNLQEAPSPIFPSEDFFEVEEGDTLYYRIIGAKRYYRYHRVSGKQYAVFKVKEPSCVAIPAGKEMYIFTQDPPVIAFNMRDYIVYDKKAEYAHWSNKLERALLEPDTPPEKSFTLEGSWQNIFKEGGFVDTSLSIEVQALPYSKIPDGQAGGLVCF